jgi:hypothetical protein
MSTRVESPPIGGGVFGGTVVIAVVLALAIRDLTGSVVTGAILDRNVAVTS